MQLRGIDNWHLLPCTDWPLKRQLFTITLILAFTLALAPALALAAKDIINAGARAALDLLLRPFLVLFPHVHDRSS